MSPRTKFSLKTNLLLTWLVAELIDLAIVLAAWAGWEVLT